MLSSDSMAWLGGCLWRKEASVALSNLSNCQLPISQFAWKLQEAVERLRNYTELGCDRSHGIYS